MAFAFVQGNTTTFNTTTALTCAYLSNVTVGNLLVMTGQIGLNTNAETVTDTQGNTWHQALTTAVLSTENFIYYATAKTTGANTVTITTASAVTGMAIGEYSGGSNWTLDQHSAGRQTAVTVPTTPSITTLFANELLIAFIAADSGFSAGVTVATPANQREDIASGGTNFILYGDRIVSSTGSYSIASQTTASTNSTNGIVSFYDPGFSITGNAGVAGATVSWSGTASGSTTADGSGNYTIPSLANGSYTITPSLTGYTFSPTSANETVSGSNITGVNFTATQQTVATPTFSPVAGTYAGTQNVTISSTDSGLGGFAITYTTDGSTPIPGSHGTVYSGPVAVSSSLTLKAVASATGFLNSTVGSAAYTITGGGGTGKAGSLMMMGTGAA